MASAGGATASGVHGQAQGSASVSMPNLADDANVLLVRAAIGGPKTAGIYMHRTQESFYCVCPLHPNCIKTRTWKAGRGVGLGHPLGYLAAWALAGANTLSKAEHVSVSPPWDARLAAREVLSHEWNYEEFFGKEAVADAAESEPCRATVMKKVAATKRQANVGGRNPKEKLIKMQ
eukprot:4091426-Amphidinium_carterae.2